MHCCEEKQTHVHEFLGSTRLAEIQTEPHNHRFAGVSGEAIRRGNSHVHNIRTNTDFFDHFHMIDVTTGPAIPVGDGRHVHFVSGVTTCVDGHRHEFIFATLIEAPIFQEC
ncbi:YmaF family protein [Clostridium botulinum]|uniref:YmaF family protein n=1 Tax=Clostridium botulinum TaxID=1491 RepID=UPI003DA2C9FC